MNKDQKCPIEVVLFCQAYDNCPICQGPLAAMDSALRRYKSGYKAMAHCTKGGWKHFMLELYWEDVQNINITGEDFTFEDGNYRYNISKYYQHVATDQDQLISIFIETTDNVFVDEISVREDIFDIKNFSLPDSLNKVKMLMAFK